MVAKSEAAEVISSGAAITYDMSVRLLASPWLSLVPAVLHPSKQDGLIVWRRCSAALSNGLLHFLALARFKAPVCFRIGFAWNQIGPARVWIVDRAAPALLGGCSIHRQGKPGRSYLGQRVGCVQRTGGLLKA
jgi:hypothetical protein